MLPDAPGLFSTITACPSTLPSASDSTRAARSGLEPAGNPTRIRTVLVGHPEAPAGWGRAEGAMAVKVIATAAAPKVRLCMNLSGGWAWCMHRSRRSFREQYIASRPQNLRAENNHGRHREP